MERLMTRQDAIQECMDLEYHIDLRTPQYDRTGLAAAFQACYAVLDDKYTGADDAHIRRS